MSSVTECPMTVFGECAPSPGLSGSGKLMSPNSAVGMSVFDVGMTCAVGEMTSGCFEWACDCTCVD